MHSEHPRFIHVMPEDYPLEGSDCVTYVLCEDLENPENSAGILLFAGSDCSLEHIQLLELAREADLVDEDADGLGGGHLFTDSLSKKRDSHFFGAVSKQILDNFIEYLER